MLASASALAAVPNELTAVEAAPLMCAGVTTYNSLRHSGAVAGDVVAILGMGGLGHLGVQFASKMGFRTVAIARGKDKAELAGKLGAHGYIDSQAEDPAQELSKLGGARVILATVTDARAMSTVIPGLAVDGRMVIVGAPGEALQVNAGLLIGGRRGVFGWPSGTAVDSQDTMFFSVMSGVRSVGETFPLERAAEAYDLMMSGKARFRVVLIIGGSA
jgi:D-arabinose 1-dehydrogenase-like Zn-dependent alcohol dehydrogenase